MSLLAKTKLRPKQKEFPMGAAFLITLREGLEAAVAIVMGYSRQLGRAWVVPSP